MPAGVPAAERAVLLELYQATGGPQWRNRDGWLGAPGTECSWHGVQCLPLDATDWTTGSVVSLSLEDNKLSGAAPTSLATLPHLHTLHLWGNEGLGPLPEEILRKWDAGLLEINAGGRATDIREIRMRFATVVLCTDFQLALHRDGRVQFWKEECRAARGDQRPTTYCTVKDGRGWAFDRLARLAQLAEAEAVPDDSDLPSFVDTAVTYLTVVHNGRQVEMENGFKPTPIRRWTFELALSGSIAFVEWTRTHTEKSCPKEQRVAVQQRDEPDEH